MRKSLESLFSVVDLFQIVIFFSVNFKSSIINNVWHTSVA